MNVITAENNPNSKYNIRWVLSISIPLGLFFNFINLYLSITMGFISVGIGSIFALLIGKLILSCKKYDSKANLSLILIAFGASMAAEASISILFLIWLVQNPDPAVVLNVPFWLLPSVEIIENRDIFNPAWIPPLITHWFLMVIPGLMGIIFALKISDKFIHNDEEYPFPTQIQNVETISVMTERTDKIPLFLKCAVVGFLFSAITTFVGYSILDFSQPENGWILGISLGVVGVTLFSSGFIIDNYKITLCATIGAIIFYGPVFGPLFLGNFEQETDFFSVFVHGLQDVYISFLIGALLGAILLGSIVHQLVKKLLNKNTTKEEDEKKSNSIPDSEEKEIKEENSHDRELLIEKETPSRQKNVITKIILTLYSLIKTKFFLGYSILFLLCVVYAYGLNIYKNNLIVTILLLSWIMGFGTMIILTIAITGIAKSASATIPPFIFNQLPIYFASNQVSYLPYIASPIPETQEGVQIISYSKLALMTNIDKKSMLVAYFTGYFSAVVTIPFFALILWFTLGIGTPEFPAPAFPFNKILLTAFAARDIGVVINYFELLGGLLFGIIIGPNLGLGLVFGFIFPPHMAFPLTLGGITRFFVKRKYGKEKVKDSGITMVTGLNVGASIVLIPLVLLAFL
ncbi:MAG: OPT/YSL family transporter [Candidatus Hodarchaeota archaeon]